MTGSSAPSDNHQSVNWSKGDFPSFVLQPPLLSLTSLGCGSFPAPPTPTPLIFFTFQVLVFYLLPHPCSLHLYVPFTRLSSFWRRISSASPPLSPSGISEGVIAPSLLLGFPSACGSKSKRVHRAGLKFLPKQNLFL